VTDQFLFLRLVIAVEVADDNVVPSYSMSMALSAS